MASINQLALTDFPPALFEIPEPPKQLWLQGKLPSSQLSLLAVVGSRNHTAYGRQVVKHLISGLAGYPIGIVSGLALGIDGIAHETALAHNLYTLAVLGSGMAPSALYPAQHRGLAERIVESGGGIISESPPETKATKWSFPRRNRIMAGLCHATILIEATPKSGTLITARLAVDYNRELLVVPGSIFSETSKGIHQFLKLGATPITDATDILNVLNIKPTTGKIATRVDLSPEEAKVISLLKEPTGRDTLIRAMELPPAEVMALLTRMEMAGYITYLAPHYISHIG